MGLTITFRSASPHFSFFVVCNACGAVVSTEDQRKHVQWHERIEAR